MSEYVRHTWADGEPITREKLNNMEAGITEAKKEAEKAETVKLELEKKFKEGPLGIEDGGTGADNVADVLANFGLNDSILKQATGTYEGTNTETMSLVLPFKPRMVKIKGYYTRTGYNQYFEDLAIFFPPLNFGMIFIDSDSSEVTKREPEYISGISFDDETNTLTIAAGSSRKSMNYVQSYSGGTKISEQYSYLAVT